MNQTESACVGVIVRVERSFVTPFFDKRKWAMQYKQVRASLSPCLHSFVFRKDCQRRGLQLCNSLASHGIDYAEGLPRSAVERHSLIKVGEQGTYSRGKSPDDAVACKWKLYTSRLSEERRGSYHVWECMSMN